MAKVVAVSAVAGVIALPETAQPEVFEQTHDGNTVAIGSGTAVSNNRFKFSGKSISATPAKTEALHDQSAITASAIVDISQFSANFTDTYVAKPPRDVSFAGASTPPMAKRVAHLALPKPRKMATTLSETQQNMYWLAADSGRRFAAMPAVRKANLGKATFVDLFTAMIQRESNFNPRAVSPVGAKGLGQLMPVTASELGVSDPFSAKQNLDGAAKYLTDMLDQFGSFELALAAYNAGPGAVRKYKGIPPYRETRQYVSDIVHAVSVGPHDIAGQMSRTGNAHPAELLAFAGEPVASIHDPEAFAAVLNPQPPAQSAPPPVAAKPNKPAKGAAAGPRRSSARGAHAKKHGATSVKAKTSRISYRPAFEDRTMHRHFFGH